MLLFTYNQIPNFENLTKPQMLFNTLPPEFTRMQAIEAGREINVNESAVDVWLKRMKKNSLIESTGRGTYRFINREGIN